MRTKIIYTRRVAVELRKQGFKILRTVVNENHPQFDAYEFEDTAELRTALTAISGRK